MGRNLWKSRYLLPLCGKLKYLKNLGLGNFKLTWHDFTMFDFQVAFMVVSLVWKATGSCRVRETIRSCLWTEASGGVRLKTSSYSALDPQKHDKRIWVQTNLVRCLHGFRSLSTHVSHLLLRLCWGVVWGSFNLSPFVFGASFSFSSGSATFSASSWHGARITRCTVQL